LKTWVSLACVAGLALSKIPAVLYVSQLPRERRLAALLTMFVAAMVCYTAFYPLVAPPLLLLLLFLGSFPSGWIFGILLQYLEGRRNMEIMNASLHGVVVFGR